MDIIYLIGYQKEDKINDYRKIEFKDFKKALDEKIGISRILGIFRSNIPTPNFEL